MQLIDGVTLKELLRYDEMPADRCLGLLEQSAGALDTAHRAGLVHRDIKPQNILVAAGDRAYLADFGLTRLATDSRLTKTGQFVGTVDYIAPEQIQGLPPTPAADVYSLAGSAGSQQGRRRVHADRVRRIAAHGVTRFTPQGAASSSVCCSVISDGCRRSPHRPAGVGRPGAATAGRCSRSVTRLAKNAAPGQSS
jgi:serine/threonine protein kinase